MIWFSLWPAILPLLPGLFWRPKQPPPPPEPSPEPVETLRADPNAPPAWLDPFDRNDPLAATLKPPQPPQWRDTLIIGAGELGGMVVALVARELQRQFGGTPEHLRNVRVLHIDVQPSGSRAGTGTPLDLSDTQIIRLNPRFEEVDALLRQKPAECLHWSWWQGNQADDYGRAGGRMALFFDLRSGTDSSAVWQRIRQSLNGLHNPAIWVVSASFDHFGSGMAADLVQIARLISDGAGALGMPPSLMLALPIPKHGRLNNEEVARSVATLREIERLTQIADHQILYNPWVRQEALDRWLVQTAALERVFLIDAARSQSPDTFDLSTLPPQEGIAMVMADSLLAMLEPDLYRELQQHHQNMNAGLGHLAQSDQPVVGSLGCVSLYLPVAPLWTALEHRAIHDLLFDAQIGLVPQGFFDQQAAWQSDPPATAFHRAGLERADALLRSLGVDPQGLLSLTEQQAVRLRARFLHNLSLLIDRCLNGEGTSSIFERRSGGLLLAHACAKALLQRLSRNQMADIKYCATLTHSLQNELERWLTRLIGARDGSTPDGQPPLVETTLAAYLAQREQLRSLNGSRIRHSLLDARLDLPYYDDCLRKPAPGLSEASLPLARVLRRIGWWCQPPEQGGWRLRLIILPPGYESDRPERFRDAAYDLSDLHGALQHMHLLLQRFQDRLISQIDVSSQLKGANLASWARTAGPRLQYKEAEAAQIVGPQVEGRRQEWFVIAPEQYVQDIRAALLPVAGSGRLHDPVSSASPFRCTVLRVDYPIPLRTSSAYDQEAQDDYHDYAATSLHILPAEQRAVWLEGQRPLSDRRVRLLASTVQLLDGEDPDLLGLLGQCWMYGLLRIQRGGGYTLQLSDGQQPDPLFSNQNVGRPYEAFKDLLSHRYQHSHTTQIPPLSRTRRAQTLRRLREAVQHARANIPDRRQRLSLFRRDTLEPLRKAGAASQDFHFANLLDALLDSEAR